MRSTYTSFTGPHKRFPIKCRLQAEILTQIQQNRLQRYTTTFSQLKIKHVAFVFLLRVQIKEVRYITMWAEIAYTLKYIIMILKT